MGVSVVREDDTHGYGSLLTVTTETGEGQKIVVSMQEALLGFMVSTMHEQFTGNQVSSPPAEVADGFFTLRSPELSDAIAREPVEDPIALTTRPHEAGTGQQPQMLRRVREALSDLRRDSLNRALSLRKNVDNLRATSVPQRRCH